MSVQLTELVPSAVEVDGLQGEVVPTRVGSGPTHHSGAWEGGGRGGGGVIPVGAEVNGASPSAPSCTTEPRVWAGMTISLPKDRVAGSGGGTGGVRTWPQPRRAQHSPSA